MGESKAVLEDEWDPHPARRVFTPYGMGIVVGINKAGTHYKVKMRRGVYRRIVLRNCGDQMKVSVKQHQQRYQKDPSIRTTTGRAYRGRMDALRHLPSDPAELEEVCGLNKIDYRKYAKLNVGHQRMCIGNVLRARLKRNETVRLDEETTITSLDAVVG